MRFYAAIDRWILWGNDIRRILSDIRLVTKWWRSIGRSDLQCNGESIWSSRYLCDFSCLWNHFCGTCNAAIYVWTDEKKRNKNVRKGKIGAGKMGKTKGSSGDRKFRWTPASAAQTGSKALKNCRWNYKDGSTFKISFKEKRRGRKRANKFWRFTWNRRNWVH